MMAAIKKWFAPPVFEGDEEKTRRASFLNLTILIFLSFLGFLILGSLFAGTIRAGIGLTVSFLFCVVLFLYYLLQHGKVALAGTGMLILVFLAIVIVEIINGTVRVPATLGYLFVIITAGVLFEWRGTLLSICICSLAVLGLILAENADMLPQSVHIIPLANWITYTWLFGLIGAVSFWGQLNTQHALGRAEQEIKARERVELDLRKLARAVEQSPASIVITDLDGNIEYVNPRFTQVTGYSSEEAAGKNPRFLKTNLTAPETHIQLWQTITQGKEWHGEFVNRKKDGTLYYESATISPIADLHGSVLLYMAIKEDVTERKQVEAALVKTALEREAALEKVSKYKLELELQNEEKAQRAAELLIANQELTFQNEEKAKRAAELLIAIQELTFQNEEKAKRAAELLVAIQELAFQNTEKAKRAAELLIANQELAFQNTEKAKRAAELLIANLGLTYQNEKKEKRAAELGIANQELVFQNEEKIKRAAELDLVNAYLENLINYANAPIIVWDPQFQITRFNHAFEFLTGRIEADVLGQSLEILFPATSIEKSMAQIQATLDGERWESVEIEILHRDASIRTVLWNSATLFEPDGKTVLATIAQGQDITRRKQVEAALTNTNRTLEETAIQRQAALEKVSKYKTELEAQNTELYDKQTQLEALRKRYFGLYDLAPVGYCTLCKKGLILEANLTAATLLGATRESMLNFPMSRFIGKNYQDQYTFHRKKFVETGKSHVAELQMVKQDGAIFWAQLETSFSLGDNKEPQARVLISDISERKEIENLLQDAEKRLSTLAEYSQALTWEVDAEGLYNYISPTCLSMLGFTSDEIIAKKYFYDLHPEEERAAFK
ncbi:MAG: PAS domain S-box protein, partial [Chloroflexi bacterium]|nr:PAS domain S-box protein [Chloroflexota bacterium]